MPYRYEKRHYNHKSVKSVALEMDYNYNGIPNLLADNVGFIQNLKTCMSLERKKDYCLEDIFFYLSTKMKKSGKKINDAT